MTWLVSAIIAFFFAQYLVQNTKEKQYNGTWKPVIDKDEWIMGKKLILGAICLILAPVVIILGVIAFVVIGFNKSFTISPEFDKFLGVVK